MSDRQALLDEIGGVRGRDLLTLRPPPPIFTGLPLREDTLGVVTAPSFTGKTMFALDMAICMDFNLPLFGLYPPRRPSHRALYLGLDSPKWDLGGQLLKLMRGHGLPPEQRALFDTDLIIRQGIHFTDPKFHEWLARYYDAYPFTVLIGDTYRKLKPPHMAENSNDEATAFMAVAGDMRDKHPGMCFMLLHHVVKPTEVNRGDNDRAAGAGALIGSADWHISLRPKANGLYISYPKGRGGGSMPIKSLVMEDIETQELNPDGTQAWGIKLAAPGATRNEIVLDALRALHKPCTRKDIVASKELQQSYDKLDDAQQYKLVDNALSDLSAQKKIRSVARGLWEVK